MMADDVLHGVAGSARPITARGAAPAQAATLRVWLLRLPGQAVWSHYQLSVVHLRPIPGVRPAGLRYPRAEYELLLVALDPAAAPRADRLDSLLPLVPVNIRIGNFVGWLQLRKTFRHEYAEDQR